MQHVCIIMPYFGGNWPSYFNIYLQSCEYNSSIDILFFTDLPTPDRYPTNVKFVHYTLSDINRLIETKLGIKSAINTGYKLCDVRPAYGFLFQEYINKYQFWGHGDIDLIYGDIAKFISEDVWRNSDVISCREEWVSGALSFFRNSEKVNTLFMSNDDYKVVFEDEKHYSYGECGKVWNVLREGRDILTISQSPTNMTRLVKQAGKDRAIKSYFKTIIKESIPAGHFVIWNNGSVKCDGKEYLLYHFITEKRSHSFLFPPWKSLPSKYYIKPTGFYKEQEFKGIYYQCLSTSRKLKGTVKRLSHLLSRGKEKVNAAF